VSERKDKAGEQTISTYDPFCDEGALGQACADYYGAVVTAPVKEAIDGRARKGM
jgi:hypothetical protein